MSNRRSPLGLVVLVAVVALVWWVQAGGGGSLTSANPSGGSSTVVEPLPSDYESPRDTTDPDSGLPIVHLDDLPSEARDTVRLIGAGGPFPYDEDGGTFGNYEGLLPDHEGGYYREYTVDTPGSGDRGARRIIQGGHGELYWTGDHYASFARIRS